MKILKQADYLEVQREKKPQKADHAHITKKNENNGTRSGN